jgi:hypothetical protein
MRAWYILSREMGNPAEVTEAEVAEFREVMKALRGCGRVPLGILAYNVEKEEFTITRFPNVSLDEIDALLRTINMHVPRNGAKR